MKHFEASTDIAAPSQAVWDALIDVQGWPHWDSGVTAVDGTIALGAKIVIRSAAAEGRAFPVKVVELDPPNRLVFAGGMPLGLFHGVRTYSLAANSTGTHVHMREEYSGPMLGMIWKSMPDLGPSFRQFVEGLRTRVESGA